MEKSLNASYLAAAGIMITATDPDSKVNWILFGLSTQRFLCHFHGNNDYKKASNVKDIPYTTAAFETAAREYAEESLEAMGSEQFFLNILKTQPHYYASIFPERSFNVRCYWFHAGDMTLEQRIAVTKKFDRDLKNPHLDHVQKENIRLMWIEAKKLYEAVINQQIEKGRYYITEDDGNNGTVPPKIRKFRRWLEGWFNELYLEKHVDPSTLTFRNFCAENAAAPIKSFLSLNTTSDSVLVNNNKL